MALSAADTRPWRRMQKPLRSPDYAWLIGLLVAVRKLRMFDSRRLSKSWAGRNPSLPNKKTASASSSLSPLRALGADPLKLMAAYLTEGKGRSSGVSRKPSRKRDA